MISKLCYELYMIDWKRHHMITADREMDSIKDYYEFIEEADYNGNLYTYDDYIEEYGYDGELYVCYDEFLETEYLDNGIRVKAILGAQDRGSLSDFIIE